MENQHCHKKAKKSHTTQDAEVVDIIFLDIDGVLLPFGGDSGKVGGEACTVGNGGGGEGEGGNAGALPGTRGLGGGKGGE